MKTISLFILLIYWSVIIFAPAISKKYKVVEVSKISHLNELDLKNKHFHNYLLNS